MARQFLPDVSNLAHYSEVDLGQPLISFLHFAEISAISCQP
jgi:hypothetical protein